MLTGGKGEPVEEKHCSIHGGTGDGSDGCVECDEIVRARETAVPKPPKKAIDELRRIVGAVMEGKMEAPLAALGQLAIAEQLETLTKTVASAMKSVDDAAFKVEMMTEALPEIAKAINNYTMDQYHKVR